MLLLLLLLGLIRLVLMGNEASLRNIVDKVRDSIEGAFPVDLIRLDMEADSEDAFDAAVQKAWTCVGNFDAFLNSYTYQGLFICSLRRISFHYNFNAVDHFISHSFLQGRYRTFCKCLKMSSRESLRSISPLHGFS